MKTFLKFLLYLFVWALITGAAVLAAVLLGAEPLLGVVIALGLFVLWLLFLGLRKLWVRWRARQRVEQLVNVEQPAGEPRRWLSWLPRRNAGPLERRFKQLLSLLRASRLREQGDPLYVLPWYLLLGENGTGKSSLLARARLAAPTIDHQALRGDGDSVDFWLTNQAVLLDAPGGYVGDAHSGRHREWPRLLRLLERHRPREPLNGVVVTVSVERLQAGDVDGLFDLGRNNRKRIDELMRNLKLRLPVYVVLTQSDRIPGFNAWCEALPKEALDQAMGHANAGEAPVDAFVREAMTALAERIKALLLVVMNERPASPELLRLPVALEALRVPLQAFAEGLFQSNVYEESPVCRGLYFTGAHASEAGERQVFASQLFGEILPRERSVRSTLGSAEKAERLVRRTVLSGYGLALLAAFAVLGSTFVAHKAYLNGVAEQHAGKFVRASSLGTNVEQAYALRQLIRELESQVGGWWIPWFVGPGEGGIAFLAKLRALYQERFHDDVLRPVHSYFDKQANEVFYIQVSSRQGKRAPIPQVASDQVVLYVGTLVRRINLLRAFLDGASEDDLLGMPGPYEATDLFFAEDLAVTTAQRVNVLYVQSLLWSTDPDAVRAELEQLHQQLLSLLQITGKELGWLVPWASEEAAEATVRAGEYWSGTGRIDAAASVPAAFTLSGKALIDAFLDELLSAASDSQLAEMHALRENFETRYRRDYLAAWQAFANGFGEGRAGLRGRGEWQEAVDDLATARNPYFRLLDDLSLQLEPFKDAEDLPEWAQLALYYQEMRAFGPQDQVDNSGRNNVLTKLGLKLLGKTGGAGKALAKAGKSGMKTQKKLAKGSAKGPDQRAAALEEAGKLLGEYRQALVDVAFNSDSRSVSYAATANLFLNPDNPGKGDGPEARAHQNIKRLEVLIGKRSRHNAAFWRVFAGPTDVIRDFMLQEASCELQERWQNKFLTELEGVSKYKLGGLMFGDGGKLWSFLDADLKPFVTRRAGAGYVPVRAQGVAVPLSAEFLEFASRGRDNLQGKRDRYPVQIELLPTAANPEARFKPAKTALLLQCPAGEQTLVNYNFPVSGQFNWNDTCGNLTLAIEVGRFTLEKTYGGPLAFAEFLRDYRLGRKRLTPEDFPEHERSLGEIGLSHIDVELKLRGHQDVIAVLEALPLGAPRQLAACWD